LQNATDDHNPARSGGNDLFEILQLDSANAEDRDLHELMRARDFLQADRGAPGLCRRGKERAEPNVIRARFGGRMKAMVSVGAPLKPEVGLFFQSLGITFLQG
jgi:hypothetical protein